MRYIIKSKELTAEIDSSGAEVRSVKRGGREYMWCGDSAYWGRVSPVLFPFVGRVRNGKYRCGGTEYSMGQHGFARDMEFEMVSHSEDTVSFELRSSGETLKKYPFDFVLGITYTVKDNVLTVGWTVENTNDSEMYFSIGAHPAFMCPIDGGEQPDYKLRFDADRIEYYLLDNGLLDKSKGYELPINNGYADITKGMFDKDALIVEGRQAREISLCRSDGKEYITVKTDAPLFGLWSPAGKNAPFICIEPWYGRCDASDFDGELSGREYSNTLPEKGKFNAEYSVCFN